MKSTPGPWVSRNFDESQLVIIPDSIDGRQPLIAIVSIGYACPDGEANARLITACPIMYTFIQSLANQGNEEAASIIKQVNA